ncbi:TauD/TfdA family dioxygenase [Xanthomonas sacchari]|uniref:TauD/TfdA-like domain-containing protein n=1 Tax=Xanthomonas sacchari TaxID=56458 RepID=A0ABT3DWF6_9XANT|nr:MULTISPECIES: TauD/TfdA family dioxygenase [Xanthomonas]MCW0371594.1 hypothetical protein [Xanthomonas sacchari]MCW0399838.1 hypothetical protein [Xanthomonas sacchari]MCW0413224.1 hypothetical protein [Xanthomonas sacchari]MCW0420657.1 hypothetical protein [Xanthomonas sacchari]MDQ7759386.1 TauD/TfdA family dioxygenase [Xanthomonas sontii]
MQAATAIMPAKAYPLISKSEHLLEDMDLTDRAGDSLLVTDQAGACAAEWVGEHRNAILSRVSDSGWVLLRGLNVMDTSGFRACIDALDIPLVDHYGDLPMMPTDDGITGVFNVTKYPAKNSILFHNEGSHTSAPPRHIFFQCTQAAPQGGETPLSDCNKVLTALPEEIKEQLSKRGLLYKRNFIAGLDVTWQKYFGTSDREAVESLCARQGVVAHWRSGDRLSTEYFRPAVISHPDRDMDVFFNQVLLHHPACLEPSVRSAMNSMLKGEDFPRNVCFGDGTPIPDDWIAEILRAHLRAAMVFHWMPGDIIVADNYAVAHARRPYVGSRQHHVILGRG